MKKIILLAIIFCSFLLAGCKPAPVYYEALSHHAATTNSISEAHKKQNAVSPAVVNNQGFYVDTNPISLKQPPKWLKQHITIKAHNLPMDYIVTKIMKNTGAFVHYNLGTHKVKEAAKTGTGTEEVEISNAKKPISIDYTGTIKGALKEVSAKTGYAYQVDKNELTWSIFETKIFNVSFMPGSSNYLVGRQPGSGQMESSGTATTGGLKDKEQYSNLEAKSLSVWNDLEKTVNELKSPDGKVYVSEATTTLMVRDYPKNVKEIGRYLKQLNEDLSRQVMIEVQVLEVTLNKRFSQGIDWNLIRRIASGDGTIEFTGNLGTPLVFTGINPENSLVQFGPTLTNGAWKGTSWLIKALSDQGTVSQVTKVPAVTLNNQVAEIRVTQQTGYLAKVEVTTIPGASNPTTEVELTPGAIETGFTLYLLPKIQGKDVFMQLSSNISNLIAIQRVNGEGLTGPISGASSSTSQSEIAQTAIQIPSWTLKHFNQRTMVPSGATLVLAGFKQIRNAANKSKLFHSELLGGKAAEQRNEETVILITPQIVENIPNAYGYSR